MNTQRAALDSLGRNNYQVVEENLKTRAKTDLGNFDSFDEACRHIDTTFLQRGIGWYLYTIYNPAGERIFVATSSKIKVKVFGIFPHTKTVFVSEVLKPR